MAETLISPGVLARENDQSQITQGPVEVGAAIIGPSIKGPVEIPTLVNSYSEYLAIFGGSVISGSVQYSYLNQIAANNYFRQGGNSLLVTRVVSGSFSGAKTFEIFNGVGPTAVDLRSSSFELTTIAEGDIMNNSASAQSQLLSNGSLRSGSVDNVRWEVTAVNTSSGVFSLVVRRGDDNNNQKSVLETYNNLSLDPKQPNYIASVIGDQYYTVEQDGSDYYVKTNGNYPNSSRYVYVSAVNYPTPDYLDNNGDAKIQYTASLPIVGSGSFFSGSGDLFAGGAAKFNEDINSNNIQGVSANDYTQSINLLSNKDDYQFNVLSAPGLIHANHSSQVNLLVTTAETRQDCIAVIDLRGYNSTVAQIVNQASSFDSSYAATYWPWLQLVDPDSGRTVWAPASTLIPGVFAYTDASSDPWFAPAGLTRGGLGQVIRAEKKLTSGQRDTLYEANINPIATFPQSGVVVFGQKTLQKRSTALDRVNVRRLLIALKSYISQVADNLVFEQNTIATRNNFLTQVNPYLEGVQQRQGLYAFKVVMDDTNNTPDVIDRNELVGQIYLQPTKTAEFIILDFNVLPTGATFPA
jgi:hypothetical protein